MLIKFQPLSMGYWMIFNFVASITRTQPNLNLQQNEFPSLCSSLPSRKFPVSDGYFQHYISSLAKNFIRFAISEGNKMFTETNLISDLNVGFWRSSFSPYLQSVHEVNTLGMCIVTLFPTHISPLRLLTGFGLNLVRDLH
jgi:hypothetical protein